MTTVYRHRIIDAECAGQQFAELAQGTHGFILMSVLRELSTVDRSDAERLSYARGVILGYVNRFPLESVIVNMDGTATQDDMTWYCTYCEQRPCKGEGCPQWT